MELANLKETFLDIYGVDLDEGTSMKVLERCIKRISEEYPKVEQDYIETVAGQTSYVIVKANMIKVSNVFYSHIPTADEEFIPSCSNIVHGSRSLSFQFTEIYEREIYNRLNPVDANIVAHDRVELIPPPNIDGAKIYFEYESYRTIEEIPEIFQDELVNLFFFYERENEMRKNQRANSGNVFQFDRRGNIQNTSTPEDAIKQRDAEFKNILKNIRTVIMKLKR